MKASISGLALVMTVAGSMRPSVPREHHAPASTGRQAADSVRLARTDEDGQPAVLPALPSGMTIATLRVGDRVFHGKGGCVSCHAGDAIGVAGKGSSLTAGLNYIPKPYAWSALDSLERTGIPESISRTTVACPSRGARHSLTDAEVSRVAAYVWAISQVRGEPWAGGHTTHR